MAFNADTYRANKYRRQAWAELAKARDIKQRAAAGTAYEWEAARIPTFVQLARSSMRISISARRIAQLNREHRR